MRLQAEGHVAREPSQAMKAEPEDPAGCRGLSPLILGASIVMIGVSSTLVGLIKVAKTHMPTSRADEYAATRDDRFLVRSG